MFNVNSGGLGKKFKVLFSASVAELELRPFDSESDITSTNRGPSGLEIAHLD